MKHKPLKFKQQSSPIEYQFGYRFVGNTEWLVTDARRGAITKTIETVARQRELTVSKLELYPTGVVFNVQTNGDVAPKPLSSRFGREMARALMTVAPELHIDDLIRGQQNRYFLLIWHRPLLVTTVATVNSRQVRDEYFGVEHE